jgi:hypothetical protein
MRVAASINPIPGTEDIIFSSLDLVAKDSRILPSMSLISLTRLSITARYDWRRTRHTGEIDEGNVAENESALILILFGSELMISSNGLFYTNPFRIIDPNFPNKFDKMEDKRILAL